MQHSVRNLIVRLAILCLVFPCTHAGPLHIATFNVDATPAIGSLVAPQVEGVLMAAMKALLE